METVEITRDQKDILKAMQLKNDELSYDLRNGQYYIGGFQRFFTKPNVSKLIDKRLIRRVRELNGVHYYQLTDQGLKL